MVPSILRGDTPTIVGLIIIILLDLLSLGRKVPIGGVGEWQLATGIVVYQLLQFQNISRLVGKKLLT